MGRCRLAYIVQLLIITVYETFLVYRGIQGLQDDTEPFPKKIKLIFSIEAYVTLNVNQLMVLQHFHAYPALLKDFSGRLRRFYGAW